MPFFRTHWRQACILVVTALLFARLFALGRDLQMDTKYFSFRYIDVGQVNGALTNLVPGEPGDYTNDRRLAQLSEKYWKQDTPTPLAQVVAEARGVTGGTQAGPYGWIIDDKGYVDLLTIGFSLFGFHRSTAYYVWFLALGLPMVLYVLFFAGKPVQLAIPALVLLSLYVIAPVTLLDDQLYSLHDHRLFAVVGIVPLFGILFVMAAGGRLTPASFVMVACWAAMLAFVVHCRSDAMWQPLSLALAAPIMLWQQRLSAPRFVPRVLHLAWPLLLVALAFVGLYEYKHARYNTFYFAQGYAVHPFWHTILTGLSSHPALAREYQVDRLSDVNTIRLIGRRLKASGQDEELAMAWYNNEEIKYEAAAREVVMEIARTYPGRVVTTLIYYKPMEMLGEFAYAFGFKDRPAVTGGHIVIGDAERRQRSLYYRPFGFLPILALAALVMLMPRRPLASWRVPLTIAAGIWLMSATSVLVSIPMLYLMGPFIVTTTLLLYMVVLAVASAALAARDAALPVSTQATGLQGARTTP